MNSQSFARDPAARARAYAQLLIISCTLNIAFLSTFCYLHFNKRVLGPSSVSIKPHFTSISNEQQLRAFCLLPFKELVVQLSDKTPVENGFKKRDLALGVIVEFHKFDLERALGNLNLERRALSLPLQNGEKSAIITLFPALSDFEFEAIEGFVRTERWPLTSEGLFLALQKRSDSAAPDLIQAFTTTPEFLAISALFSRTGSGLQLSEQLQLLAEGNWSDFSTFAGGIKQGAPSMIDSRRALLAIYFDHGSAFAGELLVRLDREFALKKLEDGQIERLLDLLEKKNSSEGAPFALELLVSARRDTIREKAAHLLYRLAAESPPTPFQHKIALERFAPECLASIEGSNYQIAPTTTEVVAKEPHVKVYTVVNGDNLWKIARKFSVKPEHIMEENKMKGDRLKIGQKLLIPD